MPANSRKIVVLGTGGTIAGLAAAASDNVGYVAAQVGVAQLLNTLPSHEGLAATWVVEQVAQVDSKDMDFLVWRQLLQRCKHHLATPDVCGIVVTHGTDTMEETAFFLHAALDGDRLAKPVVLTGAMRPASSAAPDGPQNLLDALVVAADPGMAGVMVVFAGTVHAAQHVQKVHTYRLDAFSSGEAGPMAFVEEGVVRWPLGRSSKDGDRNAMGHRQGHDVLLAAEWLSDNTDATWPRVEIVMSYAGALAGTVDALLAYSAQDADRAGAIRGLVVAGTGNGTVHRDLEQALLRAQRAGVVVVRASRCVSGAVIEGPDDAIRGAGALPPAKARIALMLQLMQGACETSSKAEA